MGATSAQGDQWGALFRVMVLRPGGRDTPSLPAGTLLDPDTLDDLAVPTSGSDTGALAVINDVCSRYHSMKRSAS